MSMRIGVSQFELFACRPIGLQRNEINKTFSKKHANSPFRLLGTGTHDIVSMISMKVADSTYDYMRGFGLKRTSDFQPANLSKLLWNGKCPSPV
jgi:hypothetical protein